MKRLIVWFLFLMLLPVSGYAADAKISALPAVTVPATTDQVPVVQSATTKVETVAQILGLKIGTLTTGKWCAESSGVIACTQNTPAATGADINTSNQVVTTHLSAALPVAQGGTGIATAGADTVISGAGGTTAFIAKAMPVTGTNGCSGAGDKLLYNSTTHVFSCGVDDTGSGSLPSEVDHAVVLGSASSWTTKVIPACTTANYFLQFNQTTDAFSCVQATGSGAPTDAHYLTTTSEAGLSAESNLGGLTDGLLKITVTGGVATPARAIPTTDYTVTVSSGTSAMGTSPIASGVCATVVTTSASGVATTDVINWGFNSDPTATTGYAPSANGMLTIIAYPTTNNVNFKVCNNTAASITPGAVTLNWRINR